MGSIVQAAGAHRISKAKTGKAGLRISTCICAQITRTTWPPSLSCATLELGPVLQVCCDSKIFFLCVIYITSVRYSDGF